MKGEAKQEDMGASRKRDRDGHEQSQQAVSALRAFVPSADPWQEFDDWCVKQATKLTVRVEPYITKGGDLYDPEYRRVLGQHQAFSRMRSFIHGSRYAQGTPTQRAETTGSVPEGDGGPVSEAGAPKGGIHDQPE